MRADALLTWCCILLLVGRPAFGQQCQLHNVDLVLAISQTLGLQSFATQQLVLNQLSNLVDNLIIGDKLQCDRLAVVAFDVLNSNFAFATQLDDYESASVLKSFLQTLPIDGTLAKGGVSVVSGLIVARQQVFDEAMTVTDPTPRKRILLVITEDDNLDKGADLAAEVVNVVNDTINIYAIGIGPNSAAVTSALTSDPRRRTTLSSWTDLNANSTLCGFILGGQDLPPTPPPSIHYTAPCDCNLGTAFLDLVLVLDTSAGVQQQGFHALSAALYFLASLPVGIDGKYVTRVAVIGMDDNAYTYGDLQKFNSAAEVMELLKHMNTSTATTVNLLAGLNRAKDVIGESSRLAQGKGKVVRVIFVASSRQINCPAQIGMPECELALELSKTPFTTLVALAFQNPLVATVPIVRLIPNNACNELDQTRPDYTDSVQRVLCNANCYCSWDGSIQVRAPSAAPDQCRLYKECLSFNPSIVAQVSTAPISCPDGYLLVSVLDATKQAFLDDLVKAELKLASGYWIGLHGYVTASSLNMAWQDGTHLDPNDYTNWQAAPNRSSAIEMGVYEAKQGAGATNYTWYSTPIISATPQLPALCQRPACDTTDAVCV